MTDRVASFALSLQRLSNDVLATVCPVEWSKKLSLPPQFVASLITDEMNRREGWRKA